MEPNIIDYYNDLPNGVHVIDKLNEEFNDLQVENNKLKLELNEYKTPIIIYSNFLEWENLKNKYINEFKTELFNLIIHNDDYMSIYNHHKCTLNIKTIIIKCLKKLLKESDNKLILKWIYKLSTTIIKNIDIFLQSMTLYPCQILSNEEYLSNIIFENIKLQIIDNTKEIPLFKCNKCKLYTNFINDSNICDKCFLII